MQTKQLRNLTVLIILIVLFNFLPIYVSAQCGGIYFKPASTAVVPINGFYQQAADFNNDGFTDLVGYSETSAQGYRGQVVISPGNGNSGFGAPITINVPAGFNISRVFVGDYDADNFKDILVQFNLPTQTVQVYRNNGDLTFTPAPQRPATETSFIVKMIDANNDGKGDLISAFGATFRYHAGNGDGTFQAPVNFATGSPLSATIYPGDFNGDGKTDFLADTNLFISQGGGTYTTITNAFPWAGNVLDVRDYNGDGKSDLVSLLIATPGTISVYLNLGNNTFQQTQYTVDLGGGTFDTGNPGMFYGNFGGNAAPDILYSGPLYNKVMLFTNDGSGAFTGQVFNYRLNAAFAGNFDSDGKTDTVVVSNGNEFNLRRRKFFDGMSLTVANNVCNRVGQSKIVDFDRSGTTDFSFWTPDGVWTYLVGGSFPRTFNFGNGSLGDIPAPGDFDGDGATDYAVYRNSTGVWWISRSTDNQTVSLNFGLPGDKPVVGDYDGDHISDIAVWRPSDGNWYIFFMGTGQVGIGHWGAEGDKPVPEDYDGDGKTDLAVYRPSTGTWYYLRSADFSYGAVNFGISTDRPIPADYDGDGKADLAVYRNSNSTIYAFRSYNYTTTAIVYGNSQIIPQPGDYNGDFVADFGYYNPSTQSWSYYGQPVESSGGAPNAIPTASMLRIE
jgi:hypothetical protein